MKKILGLDVGSNSVGGALLAIERFGESGEILWLGSRIVPLDADSLSKFENGGQAETEAAARRLSRGSRRLKQRYKLRRTRLVKVLKALGWMPASFPELFSSQDDSFNINKFLPFSEDTKTAAYQAFGTNKVSEDWLVYFLRRKALSEKITLQELARILYMLNQRRGFKSSRKEVKTLQDEEVKWPRIEKWNEIVSVTNVEEVSREKEKVTYRVVAGDYSAEIIRRQMPDWLGQQVELEITRKTTKAGEVTYYFRAPDKTDWERKKEALHKDFYEWRDKGLSATIGAYFLEHLLDNKNYRIKQQVIERSLYRNELELIWNTQLGFYPELSDKSQLPGLAKILYDKNVEKQRELAANDLLHLFANDIIYYQRPLKSAKHLIDGCRFEVRTFEKGGLVQTVAVRVAPKSSPEAQEIRIWQDIHNLRIFETAPVIEGRHVQEAEVTSSVLTDETKAILFKLFDENAELSADAVLKALDKKWNKDNHRINLFANREKVKGNETKAIFRKVFKKHNYEEQGKKLLDDERTFYKLWHALYSLNEENDLKHAFLRMNLPEPVAAHLSRLPELPKSYGAYSSKAIKKLLPLMRCGTYWNDEAIDSAVSLRIDKLIDAEWTDEIDERTREQAQQRGLTERTAFRGLPLWLASYVVYGRHAERDNVEKWNNAAQIIVSELIPNGSLRNPFVETIIRETLALVKDVCFQFGMPDEIHIELARELKKTAEEKAEIAEAQSKNNAEKQRIKNLLLELKQHHQGNPQSQADIEKFRLWKANGGTEAAARFDELFDKKNSFVRGADIMRYRLWADQHHCSPYTGKPISLAQLFDKNLYEVEHIFPKSRFFDDSFANKIICEAGVNKKKDKEIARLFIQRQQGVPFSWGGTTFSTLNDEDYVAHCKRNFKGKKLRNLLSESIPEEFLSRQLNDTRHISRKLADLLYPIAQEKEGVIFTGGSITSELKEKWGLQKVWKEILRPRFERLSLLTGEMMVIPDEDDPNKFHFAKEYKRVDHRHHALDALIIAATQRSHIQYLNTLSALSDDAKGQSGLVAKDSSRKFIQPWPGFTKDAKEALEGIIVSHKAVNRIVTRPFNKYLKWTEQHDGTFKKEFHKQQQPKSPDKNWTAVRRSMFKEPQGVIYLKEIVLKKISDAVDIQLAKEGHQNKRGEKPVDYIYDQAVRPLIKELIARYNSDAAAVKAVLKKEPLKDAEGNPITHTRIAVFKEYAAKRVSLDNSFDEKKIAKIPYANHEGAEGKKPTLPQLLRQHLKGNAGKPELAFEGEGLDMLHKKLGFPVEKVTIYEAKDPQSKFKGRYYETDKGGNVFFIIKEDSEGKRSMSTLPLLEAIERLANKLPLVDDEEGVRWFSLSPNELVYVPDEGENIKAIDWSDRAALFGKVYKMVSCTGSQCHFLPHNIANLLLPYNTSTKIGEFGSLNKSENTMDGRSIKRNCIKLKTDRLGNIKPA